MQIINIYRFHKKCPKCNKDQFYYHISNFINAKKENKLCISCSQKKRWQKYRRLNAKKIKQRNN